MLTPYAHQLENNFFISTVNIISDVVFTIGFENDILNEFNSAGSKNTDALESLAELSLPTVATKGELNIDGDGFLILAIEISISDMFDTVGNSPFIIIVLY